MFSEREIQNLLRRKGDIRGVAFKSIAGYIEKKNPVDGLKKVENQMQEWGVKDFQYQNIKDTAWYPIGWGALFVLSAMEVFNWDEQEIRKMGENAPKASIIVKLFFKLFPDVEKLAKQIPVFWQKNYTVGKAEVSKIDKKKREMFIKYTDCSYHPALCKFIEGYSERALQFAMPLGSVLTVREIECSFKDNVPYDLYQVNWT